MLIIKTRKIGNIAVRKKYTLCGGIFWFFLMDRKAKTMASGQRETIMVFKWSSWKPNRNWEKVLKVLMLEGAYKSGVLLPIWPLR